MKAVDVGKLILVGTPIGNLRDFSPRAEEALRGADFIAAEDTRVSVKILNRFGIRTPMVSYFQHNLRQRGEEIAARILKGETCALVTDAGMPCVSDPGEDLVALCSARGIPVEVAPGPCAAVTALAVSGLPAGRFAFEGFLSVGKAARRAHLLEIRDDPRTLVFYEAPHKLKRTLADLSAALGPRRAAVVRELTKIHETVLRTTLEEAAARFQTETPRGEYVLVVEGAPRRVEEPLLPLREAVDIACRRADEGIPLAQAARRTAEETGHARRVLYEGALAVRAERAEASGREPEAPEN